MGFTKKTPDSAFSNFLDDTKKAVIGRAIKAFIYVGEACLKEARLNGNYTDRTGNLRNSIGYAVLFNGEVMEESAFANTKGGQNGKKHLDSLKKNYPVLQTHPKTVFYHFLTSSELLANKLVPQIMKQLGFEMK